jgi:hypothetical protein
LLCLLKAWSFYMSVVCLNTMEAGRSEIVKLHEYSPLQVLRRILKSRMMSQQSVHSIIITKISFKILDENKITLIVRKSSEY